MLKRGVSLGKEQNPLLLWVRDMLMPFANARVSADCLDSFHSVTLLLFLMMHCVCKDRAHRRQEHSLWLD